MIVGVYGAGYVGLVTAACLAKLGHQILCTDVNPEKINQLEAGQCPIYEEGLADLIQEQRHNGHLTFTHHSQSVIAEADIHLIAAGTPQLPDGNADLSQVYNVVDEILATIKKDGVLVVKSTVPIGTGDAIEALIKKQLTDSNSSPLFYLEVASNPEFLREGSAVYDFFEADRIIIGGSKKALDCLETLYQPLVDKKIPLIKMSRRSAELTKYAANTMLASRISLINYFSQLAEAFGANIEEIRDGLALDHRIGSHFLRAGIGYGGSCFPKDLSALKQLARTGSLDTSILEAIESINLVQKKWVVRQLSRHFTQRDQALNNLKIGVWGLSFKPGTDDLREASSLIVIPELVRAGVHVYLYDPMVLETAKQLWKELPNITWCETGSEVLTVKLDALIILTEWDEFKQTNLVRLKTQLQNSPLIDGRNCFALDQIAQSKLTYYSVGRPLIAEKIFQDGQHEYAGN